MSASTEKKLRRQAREQGIDKKANAAAEAAAAKTKNKRIWTIVSVLVAFMIIAVLVLNTGFYYNTTTAVTVDEKNYSPADMNYRYATQYLYFLNTYGNYVSLTGLDTSNGIGGLSAQPCSWLEEEGATWKDYFVQMTEESMKQTSALAKEAKIRGLSLDTDDTSTIDNEIALTKEEAKNYGFTSFDKYLRACYGNGVSEKTVRAALEETILASKALTAKEEETTAGYTSDDFNAYYDENLKDTSDAMNYGVYFVMAERVETVSKDENGEDKTESNVTEETMTAAKEQADAIVAAFNEAETKDFEAFDAAVSSVVAEGSATHNEASSAGSLSDIYKEWLLSADRAEGDAEVFEYTGSGYYVVLYLGRDDNSYKTVNVRHILVRAAADENGEYTEEALNEAKAKAEEYLEKFNSGDMTEESFAALATELSEDTGSSSNGGLYENVVKGQMVEAFNNFCFDEARKPGDTGIVYGTNGSYAGYHVMYFVGNGDVYREMLAKNDIVNNTINEWVDEITATVTVTEQSGMKYVG